MQAVHNPQDLGIDPFERDVAHVVERVRGLFTSVIEAVCSGGPRAHEIAEAFRIHRKLGWQIWNVAYGRGRIGAIRHMPSRRGIQAWLKAAKETGVPDDLLGQIEQASELFESLQHTHATDREMLEMMIESCDPRFDKRAEEKRRKQAFVGNSFIWGVRANTYLTTLVLHPSRREGYFDMARVHGLIGLVRMRPNVRWPFAQAVVHSGEGERFPTREPLVVSEFTRRSGVPLIPEFCSQPLPPVQRREGQYGMLEDELLPGPMGQTGESTVVTGEVVRELAPKYKTQPGEDAMFGTGVRTPCETLVYDHLVHRSVFPKLERDLRVFSELISPVSRDERDLLQVSEQIQDLGRGTARLRIAEIPRYMELMNVVLAKIGCKADDFSLFRVRMRYPPLPVAVMLHHDLPDPPDGFEFA